MSEVAGALGGAGGGGGGGGDQGGAGGAPGGVLDGQQGGGGAAGGGAGGGQQQQAPAAPAAGADSWQAKFLPAELQNDETLGRYASVADMAKGFVETRAWAKGRVAIPGADDQRGFEEFVGKVRPAKAEDYKIAAADGQPSETGEAFRKTFHDIGLHPMQAERLTAAWNQHASDIASQTAQRGKDELTAIELDLGPAAYTQRLTAAANMLKAAGIDGVELVPALEQAAGAGAAMKALFALAEKTGELAKVDGATVALNLGTMSATDAQKELDTMAGNADPAFQQKLRDPNSLEAKKRKALMGRVAQARAGGT